MFVFLQLSYIMQYADLALYNFVGTPAGVSDLGIYKLFRGGAWVWAGDFSDWLEIPNLVCTTPRHYPLLYAVYTLSADLVLRMGTLPSIMLAMESILSPALCCNSRNDPLCLLTPINTFCLFFDTELSLDCRLPGLWPAQ